MVLLPRQLTERSREVRPSPRPAQSSQNQLTGDGTREETDEPQSEGVAVLRPTQPTEKDTACKFIHSNR